jgi:glycine C-acetyltransferase
MLEEGVYIVGFGYPVVPEGQARLRIQVSDALTYEDIDYSIDVLTKVLREQK